MQEKSSYKSEKLSQASHSAERLEQLLSTRDTWVFDLDNTLYHHRIDLFAQIDEKMGSFIANLLSTDRTEARRVQKGYLMKYGTSLAGLMKHHGVDPHEFLEDVHDIDFSPVEEDRRLIEALDRLDGRKVIFTNADCNYTNQVISRLGVKDHFDGIFDIIAAGLIPKPQPPTYDLFINEMDIDPTRAVFFEDMARNLEPAHAMGMATVWVNTSSPWGNPHEDATYIDGEIDDLSKWLHDHTA